MPHKDPVKRKEYAKAASRRHYLKHREETIARTKAWRNGNRER
jgi:hypothetical protein